MGILSAIGKFIGGFFIWLDTSTLGGFLVAVWLLYFFYKFADFTSTEAHRAITKYLNKKGRK